MRQNWCLKVKRCYLSDATGNTQHQSSSKEGPKVTVHTDKRENIGGGRKILAAAEGLTTKQKQNKKIYKNN